MREAPDIGRLIAYCSRLGMLYTDKLLRQAGYDVTPVQTHTLICLSCQGAQGVSQRELEKELRLKPSTVNGIVNRLEEKGFAARRTSPADGRCRLVSLTEEGRRQLDALESIIAVTGERIASCLAEDEEDTLRKLLVRVIKNLENEVNSI